MDRAELKRRAKQQLGGKIFGSVWLYAVLVYLIYDLILVLGGRIPVVGFVLQLLATGPLSYAVAKMLLKQTSDGEAMRIEDMFDGFKDDFSGTFLLHLLQSIFVFLWSLLLVVPGIIKALSWSMSYYVKAEHPDYTWKQCMDASAQLTEGHKAEIFVLNLSFIGWYIVGALCLGVGTLWVMSYYNATMAQCYIWLNEWQNIDCTVY